MAIGNLNIGNKLALIMVVFSLAIVAILSVVFFSNFDAALRERVLLQLSSVKQLKIVKIRTELTDRLHAFEKIFVDSDIETANSSYFSSVQLYPNLPDSVMGYPLHGSLDLGDNAIRLVDLTGHDIGLPITVAYMANTLQGYLIAVAEMPEIQQILLERTGLGQTGESYLVGGDHRLRTKSRFQTASTDTILVKTEGVMRALANNPGEGNFPDYRGLDVFSSFEKIEVNGLIWVIQTEIDHQEAIFPLNELKNKLYYILFILLICILLVSYVLSRMLVRPVIDMEKKLITMSKGILEGVRTDGERRDEIGQMFLALNKLVEALTETIVFAGKIGKGEFDAQYKLLSTDDKLGAALIQMKERLNEFQQNEDRLLKENQRSMMNGEEKERSRLSKELHDGLGPLLTTLRINVQSAELDEPTKSAILKRLDDTIGEVRRISNNLMPSVLEDFGAGEAIGNLVKQLRENSGVNILYKNDMSGETDIDDAVHIALYRIAQESINNAIKHAKATEIKVSVTEFEDHISYYISDNGTGFDPSVSTLGNGLRNMKERAKLANGVFNIESDGYGTTIEVEIALKKEHKELELNM